jgi:ABC-2 type transport system permease protein
MRTIRFLLQKEFLQIFRNKGMLPIIFILPIVQLILLSYAANFEIENIRVHVMDSDRTPSSRELIRKFEASRYFNIYDYSLSEADADAAFARDKARLIIRIPDGFERDLVREGNSKVQFSINAIDGAAAAVINGYAQSILRDFNKGLIAEWLHHKTPQPVPALDITYSFRFNPELNYKTFMVPGILVMLVTMIGMFLGGMNIVREKEIGTIEQINVTPIRKYQFIIGKLLPFWIVAQVELAIGMVFAKLVFDIPFVGSVPLVFGFAALYLLVILGFGLLVSTFTDTQQQAMFISWFFMVIFILMSGLFTPIESMPVWAQDLTRLNPIAYFVKVMRMVMLKGSGFADIKQYFLAMAIYAAATLGLATFRYRKTSG